MPRWYALCQGTDQPACRLCRRHVDLHPVAAGEKQQSFVAPAFVGAHCNHFIERPPLAPHSTTPTDSRG